MGLLEEAGILLKPGEKIVKRGHFCGKVPKRFETSVSAWSGVGKLEVRWKKIDGELILTNKRLIVMTKETHKRWDRTRLMYMEESVAVLYPDLEFETLVAIREIDDEKFLLHLNLGTGKFEETILKVDDASEWIKAIKEQCSGV